MRTLSIAATSERPGRAHALAMLRGAWPALGWWLGAVTLPTLAGYPGVVLMTWAAWLLAGWAGYSYAAEARRAGLRPRLRAGALLGALYGLALGLIFWAVAALWIAQSPAEASQVLRLSLGLAGTGMAVCASLATLATLVGRRQQELSRR